MLNRQNEIYEQYPLKVAFDGGLASKESLRTAKGMKIKDVCFAKIRGLQVEDMCRSQWVYNRLRRYRIRHIMDQKMFWLCSVHMERVTFL